MPQIENFINTQNFINTLKAPADQLLKEGVDPLFIMTALAEIIVDVAKTDRNFAATHLESVGAVQPGSSNVATVCLARNATPRVRPRFAACKIAGIG